MYTNQLIYFTLLFTGISVLLILFHYLRVIKYRGPFVMLISFLWVLIYLLGHLGFKLSIDVWGLFPLEIRYSSAFFTLIFAGILIVYICEGVKEARSLILVSLGIQVLLSLTQLFIYYVALPVIQHDPDLLQATVLIFKPSFLRLGISFLAVLIDLFFAIFFFQLLVNFFRKVPLGINIFIALWITMLLDSLIFVGGTRFDRFVITFSSHAIFKTIISAGLAIPITFYILFFKKRGNLNLDRGSMDIFKKLENMEEDLAIAHEKLIDYAKNLEKKVEDRTKEIKEKQAMIDRELEMAADLQRANLPKEGALKKLEYSTAYYPCTVVSGDLYTLGSLSKNRIFLFLGDISGHGVPSALVGSMCYMSISRMDLKKETPAKVIQKISDEINAISVDHYLTGVYFDINLKERTMTYTSGAHVEPILITKGGKHFLLEPTGSIIGTDFSGHFKQRRVKYAKNTRMVLYTDCLLEHKNTENEEFGQERVVELLKENSKKTPKELKNILVENLRDFGNNKPFTDDLTMIILDLP